MAHNYNSSNFSILIRPKVLIVFKTLLIILLFSIIPFTKVQAQNTPNIITTNGLVPSCATEELPFNLIINGSNFALEANQEVKVRIRGTTFTGEVLFTPELPNTSNHIQIQIPANNTVISTPGNLTIDIQQLDLEGNKVFSNTVHLPVYPKTGPISGAISVCENIQNNYSIPKLAGAANYEWSIISGNASVVSGGATNNVRINFASNSGMVKIGVKTRTTCGTTGSTSTLDIFVNALPTVYLPVFDTICVNAPAFPLTNGTPAGGTYAIDGVVATTFNPALVGVGDHTITYYLTQNGCTANATQTISVLSSPSVTVAGSLNSICLNAGPVVLTGGTPAGGLYSGPGITGTTFNPVVAGIGTHTIAYTLAQNGCNSSAFKTITVLPVPVITLLPFTNICINAPTVALTGGMPEGGTYTVDGVAAISFDPNAAGLGDHTITYYYTQNNCTVSATQIIKVLTAPSVTIPVAQKPICVNADSILLQGGLPSGGTYSGPGVTMDDDIYQSERWANNFSYDIPVSNGQYKVVLHFAEIAFNAPGQRVFDVSLEKNKVLDDYDIYNKVGANTAITETFSINISDGFVTIDFIGLTNEGGKDNPKVAAIEVISTATDAAIYRINAGGDQVITSMGTFTADNYYSSSNSYFTINSIGGTPTSFNPALAGMGEHLITYTVTQNGCQNSATQNIKVLDIPVAHINVPVEGTQACTGELVTLTADPVVNSKYQWLFKGKVIPEAVSNSYRAEESGSYTLQVTGSNCTTISDSVVVIILDPSNILLEQAAVAFCAGGDTTLHALSGNNYQYQWYRDGDILNNETNATLSVDLPGEYYVILTPDGCEPITSAPITVTENPAITNNKINTNADEEICSGSTIVVTGSQPSGSTGQYTYQWQSSIAGSPFTDIVDATSQDYTFFSNTFTGSISFRRIVLSEPCSAISNELSITVNQVIESNTISAPKVSTLCAGNTPGTITGSAVTGTNYTFAWESSSNNAPFTIIDGATSANFKPGILTQTTTYRRVVAFGQCTNISNEVTIIVHPETTGNSITAPIFIICYNTNPETLTGSQVAGGNGTYQYAWESSIDGTTFTSISNTNTLDYDPGALTQTTSFRRVVTSFGCVSISNTFTITVNPAISGNSILVPKTTICINSVPGTITGSSLRGETGNYKYVWESSLDGTTFTTIPNLNTAEYTPGTLTQTTTYRRIVTSGICSDTSNALTITVEPVANYTVFLNVASSDFPVCGETIYTAKVIKNVSGINYPTDPRLQQVTWVDGEDVTQQFIFDWWKNDERRLITANTSGTLTLDGLQPGDYYTVRARPIFSDLNCVTFNNRPDLIAANSGANILFSNRIYTGQPNAYAVAITSDKQGLVCVGAPVTFTAIPNDPGYVNPSYQWILNGQNISGAIQETFTSTNLRNNDVITVRFNSDENTCIPITAENPITMQVANLIENRLEKINGPAKPEIGKPATYQVVPLDNTLDWQYVWTISYANGQTEISTETSATLKIANVRPDLQEINVKKIAPAGSCAAQEVSTISTLTIPLPIELLYLTARNQAKDVILEWATAMEQNNSGFEIQVSADAVHYRSLSFVPSKYSNLYTKQVYTFHDLENGKSGTRYYRLKQINFDGSFAYLGPVAIKIIVSAEALTVYPNPFTKEISLVINALEEGNMHLVITNAISSRVIEQSLKIKKGFNKEILQVNSDLPSGIYTIITQMNSHIHHIKLLKQ